MQAKGREDFLIHLESSLLLRSKHQAAFYFWELFLLRFLFPLTSRSARLPRPAAAASDCWKRPPKRWEIGGTRKLPQCGRYPEAKAPVGAEKGLNLAGSWTWPIQRPSLSGCLSTQKTFYARPGREVKKLDCDQFSSLPIEIISTLWGVWYPIRCSFW